MSPNSKTILVPGVPAQSGGNLGRGMRAPAGSRPFGQNTLQFFEEGERHEEAEWQDTELPAEEDPDTPVPGGSFDKIPRQKSALLTLALLGVGLVAGGALGVRALAKTGTKVDEATAAFSRSPAPAPPAIVVPTATVLPPAPPAPTASPESPPVPIARRSADEAAAVGTVDFPGDGDAIPAASDKVPDQAIKPTKRLAQASRRRPKAPGRSEPQNGLDLQANPTTIGEVVETPPLRNPSRIEPPQQLSPPPEHPAPIVPDEADPFEP